MSQLSNVKNVREILNRHGFSFSKKLGQNFIVNPSVCPRIAELGGAGPDTGVLEIGPGLGVLTWELASRARKIVAIELDERLLPVLEETLSEFDNVTVIQGDVLKIDLGELIRQEFPGMEVVVCANLPYYITSPIVMHLLEARLPVKAITVMVQKEAADRICAAPGSRNAGALSAAVSYYASARVLFSVSRGSFMPAPPVDEALFFKIIRAGFSQRRKTLANSLSSGLGLAKNRVAAALEQAGIHPSARAEELTLEDFCRLTSQIFEGDFDKKV